MKEQERRARLRIAVKLMAEYGASAETIRDHMHVLKSTAVKAIDTAMLGARIRPVTMGTKPSDIEAGIAIACQRAVEMHEKSYLPACHEYAIEFEPCFAATCEQQGLPSRLWRVLYLANTWQNDLDAWCDDVLGTDSQGLKAVKP